VTLWAREQVKAMLSSNKDDEDNDYEGAYDLRKEKKTTPITRGKCGFITLMKPNLYCKVI